MPRGRPVTTEMRTRVLQLHSQGVTRNDIHRLTGLAAASVSKLVSDAGGTFSREKIQAATEARKVDLAAIRAELAVGLLEDVRWCREQMRVAGQRVTGSGDLVNLTRPDGGDVRNWMTAAGIAVQRSIELEKVDSDNGVGDAVGLLDSLSEAFGAAAKALDGDTE